VYLQKTATEYFQTDDLIVNDPVMLTWNEPKESPVVPLHYDPREAIKFFPYLTDVTQDCGPFHIMPGLNRACATISRTSAELGIRGRLRPTNVRIVDLHGEHMTVSFSRRSTPNSRLPDMIMDLPATPLVPIIGGAGTLTIFDTNTPHHGGLVQDGHERRVARGHTIPTSEFIFH